LLLGTDGSVSDYRKIFVGLFVAYEEKAFTHDRSYGKVCDSCGEVYPDAVVCDGLCPRCQSDAEELAGRLLAAWEKAAGPTDELARTRDRYSKAVRKRSSRVFEVLRRARESASRADTATCLGSRVTGSEKRGRGVA